MIRKRFLLLVAPAIIAVDQISKYLALRFSCLPFAGREGVVQCSAHQNYGLVANLSLPPVLLFLVVGSALVALLWTVIHTARQQHAIRLFFLFLILGGALGNLIDRIRWGYVFDWILVLERSVLNIADLSIFVGAIGYLLTYFMDSAADQNAR